MKTLPALLVVLFALPAAAQNRRLEGVEVLRDIEYGVANDVSLRLDLYRPATLPEGPMPAVVWIHGGGWVGGDKNNSANAVALARRGFVAVSINYRLSGEATFPAAVEDCKCAVRWLRKNAKKYQVNPDGIGVWGSSAGGHLALMVGCADETAGLEGKGGYAGVSSRVKAVCSWFGPSDFREQTQGGTGGAVAKFMGGTAAEKPKEYERASPVTHVSEDDPPVLFVHGDEDPTVPLRHSELMHAALEKAGVESKLIVVKGGGHGFKGASAEEQAKNLEACLAFFEARLK